MYCKLPFLEFDTDIIHTENCTVIGTSKGLCIANRNKQMTVCFSQHCWENWIFSRDFIQ